MEMKKFVSLAIAFAMLAVSYAMVGSRNAEATFIETGIPVGWGPSFSPRDIEWDDSGNYCLAVGASGGGASNAFIYNGYTNTWQPVSGAPNAQILTSVCWDQDTELFWVCGDTSGAPVTTVYDMPYFGNAFATPSPTPSVMTYNAIEADDVGNVLIGGAGGSMFAYNKVDVAWYPYNPGSTWTTRSITFDTMGKRFYIAAFDGGTSHAGVLYSDMTPLNGASQIHVTAMSLVINDLKSIVWNPFDNYGLAVGAGVYRVNPYIGNATLVWKVVQPHTPWLLFSDAAWDTDGYKEAAIFGQNVTMGRGVYWRYYSSNPTLIIGHTDAVYANYLCGCIKPPASPKFVFIPINSGGIRANIQALDQSTRLTANAVVPKLWWIGFNDTLMNSRMEQQVTVNSNYVFAFQYNYSLGWDECEFVIQAWYDGGATGLASNYPAAPDATTRNLAFTITCDFAGNTLVTYPDTPNLEVQTAPATVAYHCAPPSIIPPDPAQDHYRVTIPVWLGNQIRAADGSGFASGDSDYDTFKINALMDPNSWDFSVTVRDATSGGFNTSYGEFGIQEAWSIVVANNPSGNAPPGSNDNPMGPNSNIVYSANTQYYVDVYIPDLFLNGNPLALNWIPAGSVSVTNINIDAAGFSDISGETAFIGPGVPWYVWGTAGVPMNPLNNGLVSAGPTVSDYTNPLTAYTQLYWEVDVPGGTPEGIYWGTITVSITG